jgi:hypothetical protein
LFSDVIDHERRALRYRPIETGREVVEHYDALAGIDERMNHVVSDKAGAACLNASADMRLPCGGKSCKHCLPCELPDTGSILGSLRYLRAR